MIAVGHIGLLRPWWLLALPLIVTLYLVSKPRGGVLAGWETASEPHLLAAMVARGRVATASRLRAPALLITLLLGVIALSGPALRAQSKDRLRNLDATLIVMDVSQDMANGDTLREAASAAHDVLDHVAGRQAGLIVFAGDAYIATSLTDFTGAIDTDLYALDDETVPDPGVRPDRALTLAGKMLDQAHILSGDVVLISSGHGFEGTGAIRAAAALAAAGHRVYVMDAMTTGKKTRDARVASALQAVASAGGGFVVGIAKPDRLLDLLSSEAIHRTGNSIVNALGWRDLGRAFLLLAALPLLLGFRKAAAA